MQSFDFFRVQPDFAVSGGAELAFRFKTKVAFLVQLAFYFQAVFFNGDRNVFQRRIFGGKDMSVQDVRERLRVHRHFRGGNLQFERILVVENWYLAGRRGNQAASNIDQVHRYLIGKVIHHVMHLNFYRAAVL